MNQPINSEPDPSDSFFLRMFGPLADATGAELARIPPMVTRNLQRLTEAFQRKLGNRSRQSEDLSPRLFKQVIAEASWAEDPIIQEYLGGLLATSVANLTKDKGVVAVSLIRSLSSLQLRAHYLMYAELLRLVPAIDDFDLRLHANAHLLHVEMPTVDFFNTIGITPNNIAERREICDHISLGLSHANLISHFGYGNAVGRELDVKGQENYIVFHPSPLGAELFLWGSGSSTTDQAKLFSPGLELVRLEQFAPISSAKLGTEFMFPSGRLDFERTLRDDLDKAESMALEVVRKYPDSSEGYFMLAICAAVAGDESQVVQFASKCADMATNRLIESSSYPLDMVAISYPSRKRLLSRIATILGIAEKDADIAE